MGGLTLKLVYGKKNFTTVLILKWIIFVEQTSCHYKFKCCWHHHSIEKKIKIMLLKRIPSVGVGVDRFCDVATFNISN